MRRIFSVRAAIYFICCCSFLPLITGCELSDFTLDISEVSEERRAESMSKWARSCALCHINGEGGAPRVGVSADWQERIKQGPDTLIEHTLAGYNRMPPLGYCMDCSVTDFAIMIEYMTGAVE